MGTVAAACTSAKCSPRALLTVLVAVTAFMASSGLASRGLARGGAAGLFAAEAKTESRIGRQIADFSLTDYRGQKHALADLAASKLVVVAFIGAECPLAKLYAPRLEELAKEFVPVFNAHDLANLPNHMIYLKLMIDGVPSQPFSAVTYLPGE